MGAVLVIGTLLSLAFFAFANDAARREHTEHFERLAVERALEIEGDLLRHLDVLLSARAFYAASENVDPDEFITFGSAEIAQHPGIELLAWVPASRREAGTAPSYVVAYLVPTGVPGLEVGTELAQHSSFVTAMASARDTGRVVLTDVADRLQGRQRLLAVIAIDYRRGSRLAQDGFAIGILHVGKIIERQRATANLEIVLYEHAHDLGRRRLYGRPLRPTEHFHAVHHFTVGDRHFAIVATPTPAFATTYPTRSTLPLLLFGLATTAMAAAYCWQSRHAAVAREQAFHISSALASVGRELLGETETKRILDRLGELTAHALDCDDSYTWLHDVRDHTYRPVGGHGLPADAWMRFKDIRLGEKAWGPITEQLENRTLMQITGDTFGGTEIASLMKEFGTSAVLCMALRRHGALTGIQTAGYRRPGTVFSATQERIALGVTQLASLALSVARLVEDLGEANRVKSEFVSTMSHELRTPLNAIFGYTELLRDPGFDVRERTEFLDHIDRKSKELLDLIEHTLQIGELTADGHALRLEPFTLPALWSTVQKAAGRLPRTAQTVLDWAPVPDVALVTDAKKLETILLQLVANGLKFSDQGLVRVEASCRLDEVVFRVADTGIGILAEDQGVIFELFRQADSSETRRHGGTGIGLYIVRKFVEQLHGRIAVESAPGRGSVFTVTVPRVLASDVARAA